MITRHQLLDRLMVWTFKTLGKPFFEKSLDTPGLSAHLAAVNFDSTQLSGPGEYTFTVQSLAESTIQAVNVLHFESASSPVVIYNMGGGESPYDHTARNMYPDAPGYNVVAVEAPFQRTKADLEQAFTHLNTYLAMMAIAIQMNEKLLNDPMFEQASVKIVAGTSLGGFIANRHHLFYNSADIYVPFVAGTRHGDIFLKVMKPSEIVKKHPDIIREKLNFEQDWEAMSHPNVFPQLARDDQLNLLKTQAPSYGDMPLDIWDGGHLYHVYHPALARAKIEGLLMDFQRN